MFPEYLDYTDNQAEAETRLAGKVFINNTVGFAPLQRAMGLSATVPTIGTERSNVNTETLSAVNSTLGCKF